MRTRWSQMIQKMKGPIGREAYPGAQAGPSPVAVKNDAEAYGIAIQPAAVRPGAWYWQAAWLHHLTPDENAG
jgi:hypothetical protein